MRKARTTLADIWSLDGTRWAELLLAGVKIALGVGILTSVRSPAVLLRFGAAWAVVGVALSVFILLVGISQASGVLWDKLWLRQASLVGGTFIWSFYGMITLALGGTLQAVLIYVPLIVCNTLMMWRLSTLRKRLRAKKSGQVSGEEDG